MYGRSIATILAGVCAACIAAAAWTARPRAAEASPFAPLPTQASSPADNPSTPEKVALGRLLFWDPILSGSGDIACATCHHPDFGYTDGRALPIGTGGRGLGPKRTFSHGAAPLVKRNTPTILNVAFNGIDAVGHTDPAAAPMFWDSRAHGLEAQVLGPMESVEEMRGPRVPDGRGMADAAARVNRVREYRELFAQAFGADAAVTAENVARALAAFERSLITPDAPFDRYLRGDREALTPAQLRGMDDFESHGCTQCHNGPMLSDYKMHVLGVSDNSALGAYDPGADGRFAFRTPSLRNLRDTAPYMHSGVVADVSSVVGFYRTVGAGGAGLLHFDAPRTIDGQLVLGSPVGRDQLDPLLRQVSVIQRIDDVAAFLDSLNGPFDRTIPRRVPSGLRPGGR
jgi:cytochrome c peroxidase